MNYNSPIHKPHHLNKNFFILSYTLFGKNLHDSQAVVWKETSEQIQDFYNI